MSNPWFRMYAEFATDPKVQMLTEAMQRRLLMVMCLRCSNTLVTLQEQEIAFQLRITETDLADTKAAFITKGFVDKKWNVLNWDKRQFASDSSAARVAKHRALLKEKQKQVGNVTETKANALDTDTDTDKKTEAKASVKRPAKKCPSGFVVPEDVIEAIAEECPLVDVTAQTAIFRDHTFKTARSDWVATWRNWMRTKQERLVEAGQKPGAPKESFAERDERLAAERYREATGQTAQPVKPMGEVIDITPKRLSK